MPLSAEKYAMPTNRVDHLEQPDLDKAVIELEKNRDTFTWPQRRALVRSAAEQLDQVGPTESAIAVLVHLVEDQKWEVRKDVADSLVFLPDDEFPRLAARLAQDSNAFVQKAAERALDRRRRGQQTAQKKRRNLDQLQEQYSTIEKMHGSIAADRARQMAERLYDVIVGATVHDMRNILSPLKSGITSLLGHLSNNGIAPKLFEKNLTKMGYQAAMLERLLEDMRAYSQSTPGERRRERLVDVVNEAYGMVTDTFQVTGRDASKVKVWIDVPENLTVEMARYQIVRAVSNVLKNACESFADDPQTFTAGEVSLIARIVGAPRKPEKGGLHYGPMTHLCETFRRNQAGLVLPGKADRQPEASLALCWVTIMTKRRQRVHRPCDRASKEGYLWEPTSSASCTEGSIESP